jgi:hypothetical protein
VLAERHPLNRTRRGRGSVSFKADRAPARDLDAWTSAKWRDALIAASVCTKRVILGVEARSAAGSLGGKQAAEFCDLIAADVATVTCHADVQAMACALLGRASMNVYAGTWAAAALLIYLTVRPAEVAGASGSAGSARRVLLRACEACEDDHMRALAQVWARAAGCNPA